MANETPASGVRPPPAVGPPSAAHVLQEVGDAADRAPEARARGEVMLAHLEAIRLGLLSGAVPRERLEALARAVKSARDEIADERLAAVLDEIELRARVELAKLAHAA